MTLSQSKMPNAMREQLMKSLTQVPFCQILGLQLKELDDKRAILDFAMKEELIGNFMQGILHGGVISSVLDMAGGMVLMAALIQKHANLPPQDIQALLATCGTIDLQVSYLRPGKGTHFIAQALMVKTGNKISFTRMELYNEKELLLATATGTYSHSK